MWGRQPIAVTLIAGSVQLSVDGKVVRVHAARHDPANPEEATSMLVELGLVEHRHKAVLEVFDGATVTDVARRYGVSRQSVHA